MILTLIGFLIQSIFYLVAIVTAALYLTKIYVNYTKSLCTCTTRLDGKVVLITGGNVGIGFETAKRLAKHGARVVIASRNLEKSQAAAQVIKDATGNPAVEARRLDLSSFSSVKQFADDFRKNYDRLDILINNAGYTHTEQAYTEAGIELSMQVNHFGHAYLTHLLLSKIIASKPARIIFVTSDMHLFHLFDPEDLIGKKPRNLIIRYANTKLCNVLSAKALAKRLPAGVTANAVHPGASDTDIWDCVPWPTVRYLTSLVLRFSSKSIEDCAQSSIHAALAPSLANVTGKYIRECNLSSYTRTPSVDVAERVWDETIRMAEDIQSKSKS